MAKKKTTTKKTSSQPAAKRSSKTRKKAAPKRDRRANSVDSLISKYENERKALETQLTNSKKRIAESEQKVAALQSQIEKLKAQADSAETEMGQLDARRDAEIAEVLTSLGVKIRPDSKPDLAASSGVTPTKDDSEESKTESDEPETK